VPNTIQMVRRGADRSLLRLSFVFIRRAYARKLETEPY
jgi:hypothetical protein